MNPFETGQVYGRIRLQHLDAQDRITCVKEFDFAQCRAALALPDLQKTVLEAVERRLRVLRRGPERKRERKKRCYRNAI